MCCFCLHCRSYAGLREAFWIQYGALVDEHLPSSTDAPQQELPSYFAACLFHVRVAADGRLVGKAKDWATAELFIKTHQTLTGTCYAITQ